MAVEGCGLKCIKYSLFAFNLVFWLVGCIVLAMGIWFLVDSQQFLKYANDPSISSYHTMIIGVGAGIIVVGSIIMITGFFGCCGAIRESQCMLVTFFTILILIFAAMVALGVIALTHQDWLKTAMKEIMNFEAKNQAKAKDGFLKWAHDKWQCCGVESIPAPGTCITDYPPIETCKTGSTLCAKGCLDAAWDNMVKIMANGAGIALLVTCGVLVFGMVFSMCLCCNIR